MQVLQLLDDHLQPIIKLGQKTYPKAQVDRVYAKLSAPKMAASLKEKPLEFFNSDRAKGFVSRNGEVGFKTQWDELKHTSPGGWSYFNPEELGIAQVSPAPVRDLIKLRNTWLDRVYVERNNPDLGYRTSGSGLYWNAPVSDHRAKTYEKFGFTQLPNSTKQYADYRRFGTISPDTALMLVYKDAETLDPAIAETLRQKYYQAHPELTEQISAVAQLGQTARAAKNPSRLRLNSLAPQETIITEPVNSIVSAGQTVQPEVNTLEQMTQEVAERVSLAEANRARRLNLLQQIRQEAAENQLRYNEHI